MERLRPHSRLLPMRVPVALPQGPRPRRSSRLASAQEAPVSDGRHQKKQYAQPDLHPLSEARWIDHLDQVVRDESAAVAGLSGTLAKAVLQQRQWAGEAGELDQDAVDHRGNVRPDDQRPPPAEKDATHNEADDQQMDDHHELGASPVPHLVTLPKRSFPTNTICLAQDRLASATTADRDRP